MSKQIVIATKNKGKAREFMQLFDSFDVEVKTLLPFAFLLFHSWHERIWEVVGTLIMYDNSFNWKA